MMALESKSPYTPLRGRTEDGERKPLGIAPTACIAARGQGVLQCHDVFCLRNAVRGQDRREQIPGGDLLCRSHLLKSQARLDEVAAPEIIPVAPLRPIPGEDGDPLLLRRKGREE